MKKIFLLIILTVATIGLKAQKNFDSVTFKNAAPTRYHTFYGFGNTSSNLYLYSLTIDLGVGMDGLWLEEAYLTNQTWGDPPIPISLVEIHRNPGSACQYYGSFPFGYIIYNRSGGPSGWNITVEVQFTGYNSTFNKIQGNATQIVSLD